MASISACRLSAASRAAPFFDITFLDGAFPAAIFLTVRLRPGRVGPTSGFRRSLTPRSSMPFADALSNPNCALS